MRRLLRLPLFVGLLVAAAPAARAQTPPPGEGWDDRFARPYVSQEKIGSAFFDPSGRLVVVGPVTTDKVWPQQGVMRWTGTRWENLGDPTFASATQSASGPAFFVVAVKDAAGAQTVRQRPHEGGAWTTLGPSFQGTLDRLVVRASGQVCAAGVIGFGSETAKYRVACFDGNAWANVGTPSAYSPTTTFFGEDPQGRLVLAATTMSFVPNVGLVRWNGTAWENGAPGLGRLTRDTTSIKTAILDADGTPIVGVDDVDNRLNNYGMLVARRDGAGGTWRRLELRPSGVAFYSGFNDREGLLRREPDGSLLYVSNSTVRPGQTTTEPQMTGHAARWNGTTWTETTFSGLYPRTYGLGFGWKAYLVRGDGWRVAIGSGLTPVRSVRLNVTSQQGIVATNGPVPQGTAGDGARWGLFGAAPPSSGLEVRRTPGGALVVSNFASQPLPNFWQWTGSDWDALGGAQTLDCADASATTYGGCWASKMIFDPAGNVYLAGNLDTMYTPRGRFVAKWDGTAWTALSAGAPRQDRTHQSSDAAEIAVGPGGALYAMHGTTLYRSFYRWNGSAWQKLGSVRGKLYQGPNGTLYRSTGINPNLGQRVDSLYRYDNGAWTSVPLPSGLTSVGAPWTTPSGHLLFLNVNELHRFDGTQWSTVALPARNTAWCDNAQLHWSIQTLAVDAQDRIYLAACSQPVYPGPFFNHLYRYENGTWTKLGQIEYVEPANGQTTTGQVAHIEVDGDNVWLTGRFNRLNGTIRSDGFALWHTRTGVARDDEPRAAGPGVTLALASANPARTVLRLRATAPGTAPARLDAFDLLGRRVASVEVRGEETVALDVRTWAPGVYVVRLSQGAASTTQRVVVAR